MGISFRFGSERPRPRWKAAPPRWCEGFVFFLHFFLLVFFFLLPFLLPPLCATSSIRGKKKKQIQRENGVLSFYPLIQGDAQFEISATLGNASTFFHSVRDTQLGY